MPIVSAPGRLRRDEQQSPEVQGQPRKQSETHLTDRGGRKKRGREEMRETAYLLLPPKNPKPNFKNCTLFFVIKNPKCTIPMTHAYIRITLFFFLLVFGVPAYHIFKSYKDIRN